MRDWRQPASRKEPFIDVILSTVGGALSIWGAAAAYQWKRSAAELQKTLARSEMSSEPLVHEADHEIESAVLLRALEVFGDSGRALKWMRESNPALNGGTPIRAIQTEEGRRQVLDILGRIEYGVIS